jgi:CheY-like chemotaxis protein
MAPASKTKEIMIKEIMIIDDSEDFLEITSMILEQAGHRPVAFHLAQKAMNYLLETKRLPHLVLVDLNMPEMNGEEFLSAVRSHPALHHLRVVLTSAASDTECARAKGADGVLKKPFDIRQLEEFIGH